MTADDQITAQARVAGLARAAHATLARRALWRLAPALRAPARRWPARGARACRPTSST